MRRCAFISALLILSYGQQATAQESSTGETVRPRPTIRRIQVLNESHALKIEISTSSPATPQIQRLENPDRLVFDFPGFVLEGPAQQMKVSQGPVTAVRASLFQSKPPLSRIVVDLKEPASLEMQPMKDRVVIRIPFESETSAAVAKADANKVAPTVPPSPAAPKASLPTTGGAQPVSSAPMNAAASTPGSEYDLLSHARAVRLEELPALEAKAQDGDPQAQTLLALAYHAGVLLKNDEREALRLLRLAAEKNYVPAEESLGIYYAAGIGMEKPDSQAALKWYTAAAQKGSLDAATNIGSMFAVGDGVPKDMTTAIRWFRQAADAGSGAAAYNLALIYQRGDGVPRDEQQGLSWLNKAADHDFILALRDAGIRAAYPRGGSSPNVEIAIGRFKRGAELGDAVCQAILGDLYSSGELVQPDYQQAANYYKLAADQGQRDGEFGLAVRYISGQGMEKDPAQALRWFKAAADQGHADAQYDLGTMYELGEGTETDLPLAVHYYQRAAQQGVVKAQYRLGVLLSKGEGIEKDRVAAYKWFLLSQDTIKSSATELNELRRLMSPAEITEAEHQVDTWRIEHKTSHN